MSLRDDVERAAATHGLDADLVAALVEKESSGNPWAWNPEAKYRYYWNVRTKAAFRAITVTELAAEYPPQDFPTLGGDADQEWWGQSASWGLMQIMGAVAREHGFADTYLTRLCDPIVNLDLGCRHLAGLLVYMRKHYIGLAGGAENRIRVSALAAYNGGIVGNKPNDVPVRNRSYALDVIERYTRIRAARLARG